MNQLVLLLTAQLSQQTQANQQLQQLVTNTNQQNQNLAQIASTTAQQNQNLAQIASTTAEQNQRLAQIVQNTTPSPPPLPPPPPPPPPIIMATATPYTESFNQTHLCFGSAPMQGLGGIIGYLAFDYRISESNKLDSVTFTLTVGGGLATEAQTGSSGTFYVGSLATETLSRAVGTHTIGRLDGVSDSLSFSLKNLNNSGIAQLTVSSLKFKNGDEILGLPITFAQRTFATSSVSNNDGP